MRSLRLLLAVGLGLAPTLAATAAGTTPAFAGGGADMTLTATMDGQDQRLLAGTEHTVDITLADTPGEADLRDITISLTDLDPEPLHVDCPSGQNGHLSLEPKQSLQCTAVVIAAVGYHTLVARATANVPGEGSLLRTAPLHYVGFMPPPPPPPPTPVKAAPVPVHAPPTPDPAAGQSRPPVLPPSPPHFDPPAPVDPPVSVHPPVSVDPPVPPAPPDRAAGAPVAGPCGGGTAGKCCGSGHNAADGNGCCGSAGKSGSCAKHDGLAFTGMSTPMLTGAGAGGLLLVAGGLLLVRKFARR